MDTNSPPTLAHWEKWRTDAGVRGSKRVKQTWGVDKRKWDHHYYSGGYDKRKQRDYHYIIGYAWAIEDRWGHKRRCCECCDDIVEGEQSVHALTWYERGEEIDWGVARHVRCVTPELWDQFLGQPMAGAKKATPRRITEGVVAEAIEDGRLKLCPLMADRYTEDPETTVAEATALLKAPRPRGPYTGEEYYPSK